MVGTGGALVFGFMRCSRSSLRLKAGEFVLTVGGLFVVATTLVGAVAGRAGNAKPTKFVVIVLRSTTSSSVIVRWIIVSCEASKALPLASPTMACWLLVIRVVARITRFVIMGLLLLKE